MTTKSKKTNARHVIRPHPTTAGIAACLYLLAKKTASAAGDGENRSIRNSNGPGWLIWCEEVCDTVNYVARLAKAPTHKYSRALRSAFHSRRAEQRSSA